MEVGVRLCSASGRVCRVLGILILSPSKHLKHLCVLLRRPVGGRGWDRASGQCFSVTEVPSKASQAVCLFH